MSENNAPMKMKLMHLVIETNRQCNLNCTHCGRGDAQDVTITPEIIDKLLDQIDFIVELDLTGGEPFLHPEIIEYLFDGITRTSKMRPDTTLTVRQSLYPMEWLKPFRRPLWTFWRA